MLYTVDVISNHKVLERIEMDRPRFTRKEFKVLLESLRFNTLHYSNGIADAYVYCGDRALFDVCAHLVGTSTLDLRIYNFTGNYRCMLYRLLYIK